MSNSLKRFLSLAIAIVMVISMMPTNIVFAADGDDSSVEATPEDSAPAETETDEVSGQESGMTEDELAAALIAGGEVVLTSDVLVTTMIEIPAGVTTTLDLAGHAITSGYQSGSDSKHIYPINNKGTLTIKDSVGTGSITGRGIYNQDGATLTVNGVKIVSQDWNGGAGVWSYGSNSKVYLNDATIIGNTGVVSSEGYLEINGGTYTCYSGIADDGTQKSSPTYNIRAYNGLKITGGTFTSRHGVISVGGGECVIEDGSFTILFAAATTSNVVYVYGDTELTIKDGEFISDNTSGKADSGAAVLITGTDAKVTIEDGTYVGMNGMVSINEKTTIKGGSFKTVFDYNHYGEMESAVAEGATITVADVTYTKTENGLTEVVMVAKVDDTYYATLTEAMGKFNGRTVEVLCDVTEKIDGFYGVTLITNVPGGVTITDTNAEDWIDFDDVTVGAGVTLNIPNVYSGDSENVILGTLNVGETYYHGYDAKTTIQDGGKVTVGDSTILRYNENADAGIYIYGDGDDSTVEFDCNYYIGAYSGTFYAEDATIETGYFLLKNSYDNSDYADIAMTLDNSSLTVAGTTDGQDSFSIDDQASLTLKNGASIEDVRDFNILSGANLDLTVDEQSSISATNVSVAEDVALEATKNDNGTVSFAKVLLGSGTVEAPYLISSVEDLQLLRDQVNGGNSYSGKYIKLTSDIDLGNEEWTPIGNSTNKFAGYFDGGNHTITNLKVSDSTANYAGLFGYIKGPGMSAGTTPSVKDLKLTNVSVSGDYYVGGLAGQAYTCNITNVSVEGAVKGTRYVGGLAGHVYTYFKKCSFTGTAECSFDALGGIAGAGDCRAYDCTVIATVSGSNWVGGIVGNGQEGTSAVNCYVKGNVTTDTNYYRGVGGIAGVAGHGYSSSEFKNNYFDGEVYLCGEKVDAMIMGLVNADNNAAIQTTVEGNSWNTEYYDEDTLVYVVAEVSKDGTQDEWKAGAAAELTDKRNNNLVMLESDLAYVDAADADDVTIMAGSSITEAQVEEAIDAKTINGSGTQADPYVIDNLYKLKMFRDSVNAGETKYNAKNVYVQLGADIDLGNEEWTPIGNDTNRYKGIFDGNNKTIKNLKITGYKSNVGFFGFTVDGAVKNLTIENASVSGRLNVGVVAGTPYTSKYSNITVTGDVTVEGMAYVGGVGGKNAYADWTDIKVDVNAGSYVKATSTENGTAYRTYVGGVIGFMGEGGHTFKNISSNIKVIGDVRDIGGIAGIVHYGNKFENVTFSGTVEAPAGAKEVGGIAGVWHNEAGQTVSFTNVASTGTVTVGGEDVTSENGLTGGAYKPSNDAPANSGSLVVDGNKVWPVVAKIGDAEYGDLQAAIDAANAGDTITLQTDIALEAPVVIAADDVVILDLNGKTVTGTPAEAAAYSMITNKGDLTIKGEGKILCDHKLAGSTGYAVNTITNAGKLTIEGGVIENTSTASNQIGYAIDNNSGTANAILVVNGGEVKASGSNYYDGIRQFCNSQTNENAVTVNGGNVSSIWLQNPSDGADIKDSKDVKGSVSITGGNVNALYLEPSSAFEAAITGGKVGSISYFTTSAGRDLTKFISGGTFGMDVAAFCADGYATKRNADGTYGIKAATEAMILREGVAKYYSSFTEAVADAREGETVTIMANVSVDSRIAIEKNITIADYGQLIVSLVGNAGFDIKNGANVTFDSFHLDISGAVIPGDAIITVGKDGTAATLNLVDVNIAGDGYSSAFAVIYLYTTGNLNMDGGSIVVSNDKSSYGGVIKANGSAVPQVKIANAKLSFTNAGIGILDGTVELDGVDLDIVGGGNAINQSVLTIKDSTVDISGANGRAITLAQGNMTIENSALNLSDCAEGEIRFKKGLTLNVDEDSTISECDIWSDVSSGAKVNDTEVTGTEDNMSSITDATVTNPAWAAKIGSTYYMSFDAALEAAKSQKDIVVELCSDVTLDITAWQTLAIGGDTTETITINGNGHTMTFNKLNSDWNNIATNNDAKLILNNMTITDSGKNNGPWNRYDLNFACDVELNDVVSTKALAFKADAVLKDVTINEASDAYAIWIQPNGQKIDIDGLVVNSAGRGIKIDQQYVDAPAKVELNVDDATFTTAKKAAILVKSETGADITLSNVDISGVAADSTNAVWNDADSGDVYGLVDVTGGTMAQEDLADFAASAVSNGVFGYYKTLADAFAAADAGSTVTLVNDIAMNASATVAKGATVVLDLNGKTITGTDNTTKNFGLIQNNGTLTVKDSVGGGKMTLTATNNNGWNRYSAVISNNPGGTLVVDGGTIEHLGGTDMAYGIDSLTNGGGGNVSVTINDGTVKSTYRAIRQFLNSTTNTNTLVVNGGTLDGANKAVFFHDPSTKANLGAITVEEAATVNGGIYLFVTEGSTEWPVEVDIDDENDITTKNVPAKLAVEVVDGAYTITRKAAAIGNVKYETLAAAIQAVQSGETITVLDDIAQAEKLNISAEKNFVLELNGKAINGGFDGSTTKHIYLWDNYGTITIQDSVGGGQINARGLYNYGTLTLASGTVNAIDDNGGYAINNQSGSTFIMNGGTVAATNENGDAPGAGYDATPINVPAGATATINGGTITNASNFTYAIDNAGTLTINDATVTSIHSTIGANGTTTINGGSFTCNGLDGVTASVLVVWSDTTTINGGTFNGKDNYNGFDIDAVDGNVVINGGKFLQAHSGALYVSSDATGTISVKGGEFYQAVPDQFCAEGYTPVAKMVNGEKVYSVGILPNAEVISLGEQTVDVGNYYIYDLIGGSGLSSGTAPFDLQIAMQFLAKDSAADAAANAFGQYTTDFYITIDGMEGDSVVMDENSYLAGYYPSFGAWVKIPLKGFTIEEGKIYPVITAAGFDFSYEDICTSVQDFICGIHISDEILAANPGMTVQLELGLSEDYDAAVAADSFITVDEPYVYDVDDMMGYVAQIGTKKYTSLQAAFDAAAENDTIQLIKDIETDASAVNNGKTVTIDLNGNTITGTDKNTSGNFYLINNNKGNLTITDTSAEGTGKITLKAENERNWSSSSVVVANNQGTVNVAGGTIEHLGGTSMAYGIDNLTNGNIGAATTNITGGTVNSTYFAVRQFANSATTLNTLNITGGVVGYTWMQSPNSNVNLAATKVSGGTVDGICLSGVNAEVDLQAKADCVGTVYGTMPTNEALVLSNGIYTLVEAVAEVDGTRYASLAEAVAAATAGQTVKVLKNITTDETIVLNAANAVTIDLNECIVAASENLQTAPVIRVLGENITVKNGTVDGTDGINSYAFIVGDSSGNAGSLTIADGTYMGITTVVSVTNGIANITGGEFSTAHDNEGKNFGTWYMLNCNDTNYAAGKADINVTGGSFMGFNPADNTSEGAGTSFVPETHEATLSNSTWTVKEYVYSYVAENVTTGKLYENLQDAVNEATDGDTIELQADGGMAFVKKSLTIVKNGYDAMVAAMSGYAVTEDDQGLTYQIVPISSVIQPTGAVAAYIDVNNDGYVDEEVTTLKEALDAAGAQYNGTNDVFVRILADLTGEKAEGTVIIPTGVVLDIGEFNLEADYIIGLKGSKITNAASGTAGARLFVAKDNLVLSETPYYRVADDRYVLPVWDVDNGNYVFGNFKVVEDAASNRGIRELTDADGNKYLELQFNYRTNGTIKNFFKDVKGTDDNAITFEVQVSWTTEQGVAYERFVYNAHQVSVVASSSYDYLFTLTNYEGMNDLTITALIISESGAQVMGTVYEIN